jgi:hypothetical protein
MASKKPAKPIAGQSRDTSKLLPGKPTKYIAPIKGQNAFVCPTCNRELYRGIIFEHESKYFCTRKCIPKTEAA